jgi:hypothetical protein
MADEAAIIQVLDTDEREETMDVQFRIDDAWFVTTLPMAVIPPGHEWPLHIKLPDGRMVRLGQWFLTPINQRSARAWVVDVVDPNEPEYEARPLGDAALIRYILTLSQIGQQNVALTYHQANEILSRHAGSWSLSEVPFIESTGQIILETTRSGAKELAALECIATVRYPDA